MKKIAQYFPIGLTVFLTAAAILLFYDTLFGSRSVVAFVLRLWVILKPILYGAMIAYLLAPLVNFFERHLMEKPVQQAIDSGKFCSASCRLCSLILVWLMVFFGVYLLMIFLLPQLANSISQLIGNLETYYHTIEGWVYNLLERNPELEAWAAEQMDASYQNLLGWISNTIAPQAKQLMTAVSGGIVNTVIFAKNLIIGMIVSTYLMATKELTIAHCRKLICALFSRRNASWLFRGISRADDIFSGFVRGKLLDSLIIGIICFVGCSLLKIPYTPLVSVFIGVTNIIPFFGPFLGAIPSLFLILLVDPLKALYFLLFVVALQQVDGNVIGPKILSDKTGLSSLWVIVAILIGGGFFGVMGMFFGVPVCACLHTLVRFLTDVQLRAKDLPTISSAYGNGIPEKKETPSESEAID